MSHETIEPRAFEPGTVVLDVRDRPGDEQIRGALRYDPGRLLSAQTLTLPFTHEGGAIVLCADDLKRAEAIATKLESAGYRSVRVLRGGIEKWKAAGLPTEQATQEQPIPGDDRAGIHRL